MLIYILFSLSGLLFAGVSDADCLAGFYDLGPEAAAIGFTCNVGRSDTAEIVYCNRDKLLKTGSCTGQLEPVSCIWQDFEKNWRCERGGVYPLLAFIQRISNDHISYQFKSSFNSGVLKGTKILTL